MAIPRARYEQAIDDLRTRLMALVLLVEDDLKEPTAESAADIETELERSRTLLEAFTAGRRP